MVGASTRKYFGAPVGATNEELMISALSRSTIPRRPNNQFSILVESCDWKEGHNDDVVDDDQCFDLDLNGVVYGSYKLTFPTSDVLDWEDGTCWLESQFCVKFKGGNFATLGS